MGQWNSDNLVRFLLFWHLHTATLSMVNPIQLTVFIQSGNGNRDSESQLGIPLMSPAELFALLFKPQDFGFLSFI